MIDTNTIIELNNSTTSERRMEFMNSIIHHENNNENRALLIEHSSPEVRTYLHELLIRSANNSNITEEVLYRIGNIFLYTISNLDIDGLVLRDVIQNMRESMVMFNTNQIYSILENQVSNHNQYLEEIRLASEEHIDERVQEFHREVDQKIALNRNGILGSMALTSIGVPQIVSGLVARSVISPVTTVQLTEAEGIIRFRDILDEGIKLFYNTLKSFNK